jgi:hypothetical protein
MLTTYDYTQSIPVISHKIKELIYKYVDFV